MPNNVLPIIGQLGNVALGVALLIIAQLSRRLGRVTKARSYYIANYLAAILIWIGVAIRLWLIITNPLDLATIDDQHGYILLSEGLLASGVTIGSIVTWYYWSWLVAERD